jgi:hypothetical protein
VPRSHLRVTVERSQEIGWEPVFTVS